MPPTASQPEQSILYRWLWRWHGYAGLFVIPFIFFMALTGLPYVWQYELEDWLHPEYRALPPQATRVSYEQQLAAARAACPEKELDVIKLDGDPRHATHFQLGEKSNPTSVLVNPYDGSVIVKMNEWTRLSQAAIMLHGLVFAEPYGSWLLELLACWGIILCATGVYLWWPRGRDWSIWGTFLPRLSSSGRTRWRDVHAVTGFYFALVLALYLATGLPWTAFWGGKLLSTIQEAAGEGSPLRATAFSSDVSTPPSPDARPLPLDAFVEFALAQSLPGHHVEIELPKRPQGTVHVTNRTGATSDQRHFQLDAYTGRPVGEAGWGEMPLSQKAVALGINMHEGSLFGRPTQILSTVLALTFMLMAGAGIVMWWKRRPQGRLDWPKRIDPVRVPLSVKAVAVVLGLLMPLFGASLLFIAGLNRLLGDASSRTLPA